MEFGAVIVLFYNIAAFRGSYLVFARVFIESLAMVYGRLLNLQGHF